MTLLHCGRYLAIATLLLFAGCSHRVPEATIEVIDTSLSITPRAEKAVLDSVQGQIFRMHRGDPRFQHPYYWSAFCVIEK